MLGNLSLTAIDTASSLMGGQGSVINGLHNGGDVAAYGVRSLVASNKLNPKASKRLLIGANLLTLSLTGWLTTKSGIDLMGSHGHIVEPGAVYLETASSLGNFAIASGLEADDDHGHHGHDHSNQAVKDGHHHAKTDARASLIAVTGLSLAGATSNSKWDSAGALVGGLYFSLHMAKHIFNNFKNSDDHHGH